MDLVIVYEEIGFNKKTYFLVAYQYAQQGPYP